MLSRPAAPAGPAALAGLSLLSFLLCASGCISINVLGGRPAPLVESRVEGEGGPKILLLEIEGMIEESPREGGLVTADRESSVARVREQLDRARRDRDVRALLLRINSPGGTVAGSDLVYQEILRFKREQGVPVVAQLMGLATSGAYYVAMAADEVIALPTTVTGSLGVLFIGVSFSGLMQKLGIEDQTLVSGRYKDATSPLRRMTPEERAQIQSVLDDMHDRFKQVIAEGRPHLDRARIDEVTEGSIYSALQARERGLVDRIGDLSDARAAAEQLAGLETSQVVAYHRPREWKQNVYNRPVVPPKLELELKTPLRLPGPGFLYLWTPVAF